MEPRELDATGLRCPMPILSLTAITPQMRPGEHLEIIGDCATFEADVKVWCRRLSKTLLYVKQEEGYRKRIGIRF